MSRRVMIELVPNFAFTTAAAAAQELPGVRLDTTFPPTPVPRPTAPESPPGGVTFSAEKAFDVRRRLSLDVRPSAVPYVVRGEIDEDAQAETLAARPDVRAVYSDPAIQPLRVCPGSPPLGGDHDVARLLCADRLAAAGMDGRGVLLAIVDTGINLEHLRARGKEPRADVARSWMPANVDGAPFAFPVGHGTMCAYDALIAAPAATLLDVAVLQSRRTPGPGGAPIDPLLSDAVLAYNELLKLLTAPVQQPGEARSLVISNSWGVFSPTWDFPPGHAGNYSDNPEHPFNRIVTTLESFGADILFAAGNCGADCPDGRCAWPVGQSTIAGANGHPAVLSVAGVDVTGDRVGYSSTGPGRLADRKPDICGFTHFSGSGVYPADGSTSAACPVVAGVVAALRSRLPATGGLPSASPVALRDMLCKTAHERGNPGYDYAYGWGIVNACRAAEIVQKVGGAAVEERVARAVDQLATDLRGERAAAGIGGHLVTAATATHVIGGVAKATKNGTLDTGTLIVNRRDGGFAASRPMQGTGTRRSASITVTDPGNYEVTIDVTAGDGTFWEGAVSLDGTAAASSGSRTVSGQSDQWFTDLTIS